MPTKKKKGPNVETIGLSQLQLAIAKDFIEDLGIGTKDPLYYYAVLWCRGNVKPNGDFLSNSDRKIFDKDKDKGKKGRVHAKLIAEIIQLELTSAPDKEETTDPTTAAKVRTVTNTINRKLPRPKKKPEPPKVTITSDRVEVEKGERYTISWKAENADLVSRSTGFASAIPDLELSGSRTIISNRIGSKRYEISVRKGTKVARASVIVQTVAARVDTSNTTTPSQGQSQQTSQRIRTPTTTIRRNSGNTGNTAVLTDISKSLENIVKILGDQSKFFQRVGKVRIKEAENEKRNKREEGLEGLKSLRKTVMTKAIAPIENIMERIIKFIMFVFLGRAFTEFLKWFNDPKNADKVKTLGRFLKDFWPIIGGVALWFLTPLGGFVKGLIKTLGGFTRLLLRHPIIAGGAVAAAATLYGYSVYKKGKDKEQALLSPFEDKLDKKLNDKNVPWYEKLNAAILKSGTTTAPYGSTQWMMEGRAGGGIVTDKTGTKVRGAGPDTQLTALTPGEAVLQKGARERMISSTGIDPLAFNIGPNANNPRTLLGSKLTAMNTGGVVGIKNPKINMADYNALLAIAAAEDFANPQGRADVAQSLYNRLFAANRYGMNFNQSGSNATLKNLITAPGQFQPTFKNREDWLGIKDRKSAAIAFSNYKKIPLPQAMKVLDETDKILKNPKYQENARSHVQGRAFFLGTSEHGNMKSGDVLRSSKHNFFSHWHAENTPYHKERGDTAAPIPINFVQKSRPKTKVAPSPLGNFANMLFGAPRPAAASQMKKPQRAWYDPRGLMGFNRGGLHVSPDMPKTKGKGLDKYFALLSNNEYVIPSATVRTLGVNFFDNIVASTDKNSNAARLSSIRRYDSIPPPLSSGASSFQVLNLPPVMGGMAAAVGGSKDTASIVPSFSAVSPVGSQVRKMHSEIYGIQ